MLQLLISNVMWDGDHATTVCVRGTNTCITHAEGDVINNLPHPIMMTNLLICTNSGLTKTGLTRLVLPPLFISHEIFSILV